MTALPVLATKREIRCFGLICRSALDVPNAQPSKKFTIILDRVAEPQNDAGQQVEPRQPLSPLTLKTSDFLVETFTVDGIVLTGAQILKFANAVVDAHKGDSEPTPTPPGIDL